MCILTSFVHIRNVPGSTTRSSLCFHWLIIREDIDSYWLVPSFLFSALATLKMQQEHIRDVAGVALAGSTLPDKKLFQSTVQKQKEQLARSHDK
jgi:hypothetical protein